MDKRIKRSWIFFAVIVVFQIVVFVFIWSATQELSQKYAEHYLNRTPEPYTYVRNERSPKIPQTERESDFKNLVDCDDYFADKEPVYDEEYDGYLVSHNMFYRNDGDLVIVDISSADYRDGVFCGRMNSHFTNVQGGGVVAPCAYDSDKRSALSYTYKDHYSLILDDYNNDGNPDFLNRTGDPLDDGSFYYIEFSRNESYSVFHTNFLTERQNSDSAVFVYNSFDDSIRLDHLDMDHFFFLTVENDRVVPYVVTSSFVILSEKSVKELSTGGRLYSAFYEDGVLSLKATDTESGMKMYNDPVKVIVRKLEDNRKWTGHNEFTVTLSDEKGNRFVHKATAEHNFSKGLYQAEFVTPDGSAYAEFRVR